MYRRLRHVVSRYSAPPSSLSQHARLLTLSASALTSPLRMQSATPSHCAYTQHRLASTQPDFPLSEGPVEGETPDPVEATPFSPLLRQIQEYQQRFPQRILLTRVGEFYELYFDQADEVGRLLHLTIVNKTYNKQQVRFGGFPIRQLSRYLPMLVRVHGRTVALNEQFQDSITKAFDRRVTRIVTPGTLIVEENTASEHDFLLSIIRSADGAYGLAWLDLSTGDFFTKDSPDPLSVIADITRISPREVVIDADLPSGAKPSSSSSFSTFAERILGKEVAKFIQRQGAVVSSTTLHPDGTSEFSSLLHSLSTDPSIASSFSPAESLAGAQIIQYVRESLAGDAPPLTLPRRDHGQRVMRLDHASVQSLELLRSLRENTRAGSVLSSIDRTVTAAGSRLLSRHLASPSTSVSVIQERLDWVGKVHEDTHLLADLRSMLKGAKDAQRAVQQLSLGVGRGQGLIHDITRTILLFRLLRTRLEMADTLGPVSQAMSRALGGTEDLALHLERHINLAVETPGDDSIDWIRLEAYPELQALREELFLLHGKQGRLQDMLKISTGSNSVRLVCIPNLRHVVEVSAKGAAALDRMGVPLLQTLRGKRRYRHKEWCKLGEQMGLVEARIEEVLAGIYDDLRQRILKEGQSIAGACRALARLDVACSHAIHAHESGYVRPEFVETGETIFDVKGGRHALVEAYLGKRGRSFVSNDCTLTAEKPLWLITGPNMGGKSTFLRQNALLSILAQMGSYVPAARARLSLVDAVFTRVGAADNLAQDQSTFMVEMLESAHILRTATPKSLVIMDEVGRGTSTSDGLALSSAILSHLRDKIGCRTLFATHFRELADHVEGDDRVACYRTRLSHGLEGVSFDHRITPGVSRSSHGLIVAELAGLPESVIREAYSVHTDSPDRR